MLIIRVRNHLRHIHFKPFQPVKSHRNTQYNSQPPEASVPTFYPYTRRKTSSLPPPSSDEVHMICNYRLKWRDNIDFCLELITKPILYILVALFILAVLLFIVVFSSCICETYSQVLCGKANMT